MEMSSFFVSVSSNFLILKSHLKMLRKVSQPYLVSWSALLTEIQLLSFGVFWKVGRIWIRRPYFQMCKSWRFHHNQLMVKPPQSKRMKCILVTATSGFDQAAAEGKLHTSGSVSFEMKVELCWEQLESFKVWILTGANSIRKVLEQ